MDRIGDSTRQLLAAEMLVRTPFSPGLSADDRVALSILEATPKSAGPSRRCGTCGVLFPPQDLHADVDEDGRRTGWTCDGCG